MSDVGVLKSSERVITIDTTVSSPVKLHLEWRLSANKHLLQMYEFSKAALTEQTNIRCESKKDCARIS